MKNNNIDETNNHKFMAMEVLCPNADKTDSNRLYMFGSSHIAQAANLATPEVPIIFTNFENEVGKYSDLGFTTAKEDMEVISKITKNENVYYLLVHYLESDTYDIIERRKEFWLTEKYGYTINNEYMDSLVPEDKVEQGTKINKCFNYDENDNFMYGTNLRTIYYTEKCKTLEDPMVVSSSAAEKLKSYTVESVTTVLNNNDLLLNISDDPDTEYKTFPGINEKISNFLCIRRRINQNKLYSFDDLTINSLRADDEKFYAEGDIVDIDIYSNIEEKDLEGNYNKQIRSLIKKRKKFNSDFIKATEDILINKYEGCSSQLIQMYNRIKMEQDQIKFSYENSIFDGIVIKFSILKENHLVRGSKLSGRYGNKGVISEIMEDKNDIVVIDDSQMPIIKSGPFKGLRAEVCLNPLGIIGRLNVSQNYEHEFNFISMYIRLKIKEASTRTEKEDWYFNYVTMINSKQGTFTKEFYDTLSDEDKDTFLKQAEDVIYIHQEPFFNKTDFELLCDLYDTYDFVKPFEFEGINTPLIMGEMYFLRLKHDPIGKMSARSTGFENLKNSPSKDRAYKFKKSNISKTPIRLGNMEILNLLLTSDSKSLGQLLSSYSTNEDGKTELLKALLTRDPYDINVDLTDIDRNETQKLVDSLLFNLGLKLEDVKESEKEEPIEISDIDNTEETDITDIQKGLDNLLYKK